jgi:1,4-alpha-glucan branching enzyme
MSKVAIEFVYYTSVPDWPPIGTAAQLRGSWNANGGFSLDWSSIPMRREFGTDGCAVFRATALIDSAAVPLTLEWGVMFQTASSQFWGIPTEVEKADSTRQTRLFLFDGSPRRESYYLTHCRRLGANLRYLRPNTSPGVQFSAWAPNASTLELVNGSIFDLKNKSRLAPQAAIRVEDLGGGFISDRGDGISPSSRPISMRRADDGVWETDPADPLCASFKDWDHRPYMYRLVRDDGSTVYRTDLYSRCQVGFGACDPPLDQPYLEALSKLEGRLSCSAVIDPTMVAKYFEESPSVFPEVNWVAAKDFWSDEWEERPPPVRIEDLIIYELHLGALGFGSQGPGTLKDAIGFIDHLVALGVNAVELLPLSEFGGGGQNWGYSTSHYFAIEYAGGGRDKFKHFVKTCHQRGLAVIMDVVYNHYDQEAERAERAFDSPAPERDIYYWYEGVPSQYAFPRGGYLSNLSSGDAPAYHEEMVRKLFISSAVALLEEFHIDGFRVDQTTSIHSYNQRVADGAAVPSANQFGAKLLREFGRTLRLFKAQVFLMAEDYSTWDQVTLPVENGGMGFHARWFADFYHHLIGDTNRGMDTAKLIWVSAAFSFNPPPLRMDLFADQLAQTGQAKVVYNESHDEAGNSGGGPFLDPDWEPTEVGKQYTSERTIVVAANAAPLIGATRDYAEARCRFAYGMTVFSAGTPMFLFGEEVGAERRFKYNKVLENREDYLGMRTANGQKLFEFYAAANRLRTRWPGLRSRNIAVVHTHNENRVISFVRWQDAETYLVIGTLSDIPYTNGYHFQDNRIWDGAWTEIFNSDSGQYGGANVGNCGATLRVNGGSINCNIPANGFVIFQRVAD